jgi:hypothetical protein
VTIGEDTRIVVAYAQRDEGGDETVGAGLGVVNVFDTAGTLVTHLVAAGEALNAPWGIALAPADFGSLGNKLLIGNFGDGVINAYDPESGAFAGNVKDANGDPVANPGLWGIAFGNGARNQPTNTLYFAAGIGGETAGLYGRIDQGDTPPDIVAPTVTLDGTRDRRGHRYRHRVRRRGRQRRRGAGGILRGPDVHRCRYDITLFDRVGHDRHCQRRHGSHRSGEGRLRQRDHVGRRGRDGEQRGRTAGRDPRAVTDRHLHAALRELPHGRRRRAAREP